MVNGERADRYPAQTKKSCSSRFERMPPQRVVAEGGGDAAVVGRRGHAVEAVPFEDGSPAVAHPLGHVAAFVVAVAGAGVVLQQVVQQLAGWVLERLVGRGRVDDVACGVEGEGLAPEAAVGFQQAPHRVVAVVQAASAAVTDGHQLANLVVGKAQPFFTTSQISGADYRKYNNSIPIKSLASAQKHCELAKSQSSHSETSTATSNALHRNRRYQSLPRSRPI